MFNKFIEFISNITMQNVINTSTIVFLILIFNKYRYYKRRYGNKMYSSTLKNDIKDMKKKIEKYK